MATRTKRYKNLKTTCIVIKLMVCMFVELFEVWFKHTGMHSAGDELLINNSTRLYSIGQIQSAVGRHTLTHIFLSREMLPKIDELAPQLSHLRLFFFTSRQVSSPHFSR